MASVSWRRDSADERLFIEEARSRRRREVEESIASRSGSVRFVWDAGVCDAVVGEVCDVRRWGAAVVER